MSRQTDRAAARLEAKKERAAATLERRAAVRGLKGLTPLSRSQKAGYPQSTYVPHPTTGKVYPFGSRRQGFNVELANAG